MKTATCAFAVLVACSAAFAEPSVLELGFELGIKPSGSPAAQEPAAATNVAAKAEATPAVVTNAVAEVEAEAVAPATNALAEAVAASAEEPAEKTAEEEAAVVKPKAKKLEGRPAKITSDSTIYNRKEGIACFEGHVHVDDEQYQMHADKVFLFLEKEDAEKDKKSEKAKKPDKEKVAEKHEKKPDGTNDVKRASSGAGEVRRIVAIGNIAMTNEARRAYGAKATYSRKNGLVVLYSGDGITAEVRDESKAQPQVVRGKRIRFWLGTEQVEVDEADLTGAGPAGGASSLKKVLGK
jgi:lipopolysaccharide export system protein LptA